MEPHRMRLRPMFLTLLGVFAVSAAFAGPALAGTMTITPSLQGAGKVEDPGNYLCAGSPPANGTVTLCSSSNGYVPPCSGLCLLRTVLNLKATPEPGWRFVGWAGNAGSCSTDPQCNFSIIPLPSLPDVSYTPVAVFHEIVDATIATKPPAFSPSKSASFSYASNVGTSVQCKLDGATRACPFAAHNGAVTLTDLPEGAHTFQVTALSPNGNPSEPA